MIKNWTTKECEMKILKTYDTPKLEALGSLQKITKGGSPGAGDSGAIGSELTFTGGGLSGLETTGDVSDPALESGKINTTQGF